MSKYTIGVDMGGTNIKLGLVHSTGRIVSRTRISTKAYSDSRQKLIKAIVHAISELIAEKKLKKSQIQGIGMGLPGLINPAKGVVVYLPNVECWKNVALKAQMEKHLGIPTYIDNDVNLITLAEWKLGAGKGVKNFVCITLGTGVGGGLILDNKLYRGEGFVAGEIGHMPLEDKTLELFVGNAHLKKKVRKIFKNEKLQLEDIFRLASVGNVRAQQFWQETGEYIGTTLSGVINVLNPRLIVVGGGVSNNFKYLKDSISAAIKVKSMKVQSQMVRVVRAKLGDDAGILGGHILVKETKLGHL